LQNSRIISIVDDDQSVRAAMRSLVRSLGFNAQTFASAEEFLQSPHLDSTLCLISDIQMPGMNGIELQKRLALQDRRLPIIFITAYPNETTERNALQAGAVCFLHKPCDSQVLINCIRRALGMTP
jgi:FixJ family two-component response regulator